MKKKCDHRVGAMRWYEEMSDWEKGAWLLKRLKADINKTMPAKAVYIYGAVLSSLVECIANQNHPDVIKFESDVDRLHDMLRATEKTVMEKMFLSPPPNVR